MIKLNARWEEFNTVEKWRRWLDMAAVECPDYADWWGTIDGCENCRYFDNDNIWCTLVAAPATYNPILNMLGMACCGAGFERVPLPGEMDKRF